MTTQDSPADVLTSRPPPEAQRVLWLVTYVSLGVGWVLIVAVSILALATGGNPAGILFLVGLGVFFTVVVVLFRRPPLVRQRQRTST
ncbi:MAG TPA: hypothetical protein VK507_22115 [Iamia sp.]|nr:hypothetical protein [Iamia sp.]